MWASASREHAQRLLIALRGTAARVEARDLAIVFRRVAAVLLFLELLYLGVGNALLRTHAIQDAVASGEGFHLDFGSAYTLWPGHARVRDLSLRVEDYNVQFEVAIARADVDIALAQLLFKKFRVTKLRAEGTRFRMRHKLIAIGDDAERVAAYPPIRGFADPPYYVGVRSPPIPDADYDLWQVRIENVEARVSELWVMEYRFLGRGVARGSFVVKPARWVQVEPATLELEDGRLTLGEHQVAEHVRGRLTCDIPDMHVQETEGVQVLRDILAGVHLQLSGGKLDFLQAYLARLGSARYSGEAEWRLDAKVLRGVVAPGTRVDLRATPLNILHQFANFSGDLTLSLERPAPPQGSSSSANEELVLTTSVPHVAVVKVGRHTAGPSLDGVVGSLHLHAVDLKTDLALGRAELSLREASVPELAWFDAEDTRLRGSARAGLEVYRSDAGLLSGSARVRAKQAGIVHDELSASGNLQGELAFSRPPQQPIEMKKLDLRLTDAQLSQGGKHSKVFGLSLAGDGLRVSPQGDGRVDGSVRVHLSSTEALLPLVLKEPIKGLAAGALDLQALDGRASIELSHRVFSVERIEARSGKLRVQGHVSQGSKQANGAFLFSSGLLNVGVTLEDGDTQVSPFVADDWLAADAR